MYSLSPSRRNSTADAATRKTGVNEDDQPHVDHGVSPADQKPPPDADEGPGEPHLGALPAHEQPQQPDGDDDSRDRDSRAQGSADEKFHVIKLLSGILVVFALVFRHRLSGAPPFFNLSFVSPTNASPTERDFVTGTCQSPLRPLMNISTAMNRSTGMKSFRRVALFTRFMNMLPVVAPRSIPTATGAAMAGLIWPRAK